MNNSDHTFADHDQSGRYEQQQFGEYQVRYKIGEGGMAEVYQAEHPSFGMVALKVLKPSGVKNNDTLNRFIREAQTINKLHHPHIVTIYETGQIWFQPTQQTVPFIAMEYLSGGTLSDRLNHQQSLDFMLKVGEDIGSALDYAHGKKIIHRDIKPSNILFRKDGKVFLADFGIALVSDQDRLTHTGGFAGTMAYTAPEVFRNQTADARADIYALGLILYQALSGKHPYYTANDSIPSTIGKIMNAPIPYLPDLAPLVPVRTAEVIAQATAREPSQRFATMADFIEALKQSKYHQARSIPNQPIPQAPPRVAPTREHTLETTVYATPAAPATRSRTVPGRPIAVDRPKTHPNRAIGVVGGKSWQSLLQPPYWKIGGIVIGLLLVFILGGWMLGKSSNAADTNDDTGKLMPTPSVLVPTVTQSDQPTVQVTATIDAQEAKRIEYALGQEAYLQQNWPMAAQSFDRVWDIDPNYLDLKNIGAATYFNWSLSSLSSSDAVGISKQYAAEVFRFDPNHDLAKRLDGLLGNYANGEQALAAGDWDAAIEQFSQTLAQIKSAQEFAQLKTNLGLIEHMLEAYLAKGQGFEEAGQLTKAREVYTLGLALVKELPTLDVATIRARLRAISPTAVPATPTRPAPPTATPAPKRLYVQKYAPNAVDPTCFAVHIRGVATSGWFVTVDGLGNRGNVDGAGNTNVCGLVASQEVTFTIYNAQGAPVPGGGGIPTRGGDLMAGYWQ